VQLLARADHIRWLRSSGWLHARAGAVRQLLYPPTDVGPPGLNQITARPGLWKAFPRATRAWIAYRSIRPAATSWLEPRAGAITITTGKQILAAEAEHDSVQLTFDDGSRTEVDRVVMATGFRLDIERLKMLAPELRASIDVVDGYPKLRAGLESSVPR